MYGRLACLHRSHDFLVGRRDDYEEEADENHGVGKIGPEGRRLDQANIIVPRNQEIGSP